MCDLIKILIVQIPNEKLSFHSIKLGCPGSDMSLGVSNMKLRIMGVLNTPKKKGNWSMVDSVTNKNKYEFIAVPREKKKRLFLELTILFLLERTEIMFK